MVLKYSRILIVFLPLILLIVVIYSYIFFPSIVKTQEDRLANLLGLETLACKYVTRPTLTTWQLQLAFTTTIDDLKVNVTNANILVSYDIQALLSGTINVVSIESLAAELKLKPKSRSTSTRQHDPTAPIQWQKILATRLPRLPLVPVTMINISTGINKIIFDAPDGMVQLTAKLLLQQQQNRINISADGYVKGKQYGIGKLAANFAVQAQLMKHKLMVQSKLDKAILQVDKSTLASIHDVPMIKSVLSHPLQIDGTLLDAELVYLNQQWKVKNTGNLVLAINRESNIESVRLTMPHFKQSLSVSENITTTYDLLQSVAMDITMPLELNIMAKNNGNLKSNFLLVAKKVKDGITKIEIGLADPSSMVLNRDITNNLIPMQRLKHEPQRVKLKSQTTFSHTQLGHAKLSLDFSFTAKNDHHHFMFNPGKYLQWSVKPKELAETYNMINNINTQSVDFIATIEQSGKLQSANNLAMDFPEKASIKAQLDINATLAKNELRIAIAPNSKLAVTNPDRITSVLDNNNLAAKIARAAIALQTHELSFSVKKTNDEFAINQHGKLLVTANINDNISGFLELANLQYDVRKQHLLLTTKGEFAIKSLLVNTQQHEPRIVLEDIKLSLTEGNTDIVINGENIAGNANYAFNSQPTELKYGDDRLRIGAARVDGKVTITKHKTNAVINTAIQDISIKQANSIRLDISTIDMSSQITSKLHKPTDVSANFKLSDLAASFQLPGKKPLIIKQLYTSGTINTTGSRTNGIAHFTLHDKPLGKIKLTDNRANQEGVVGIALSLPAIDSFAEGSNTIVNNLNQFISLQSGTAVINGDLHYRATPNGRGWGRLGPLFVKPDQLNITLEQVTGNYEKFMVDGLQAVVDIVGINPITTQTKQQLQIRELGSDLRMKNVRLDYQLTTTKQQHMLIINSANADILGGTITIKNTKLSPTGGHIPIYIDKLKLDHIFTLVKQKDLTGQGIISGIIPVSFNANDIEINDGLITNDGPGIIHYRPAQRQLIEQQSQINKVVLDALHNFHFNSLDARLSHDVLGKTKLNAHFKGKNPDLYKGHPINFNVTVSGDILRIVQASLIGQQIDKKFIDKVKR